MSSLFLFKHWPIICFPVAIAVTAIAWSGGGNRFPQNDLPKQDSLPPGKNRPHDKTAMDKDLDRELEEIDKAIENLDGKIADIDWSKLDKQIEQSLRRADKEMEHMDMEKIDREIKASIRDIDFEKIKKETDKAMQQVEENTDFTDITAQVKKSLGEVRQQMNSEAFRKSVEAAKEAGKNSIKEALEHAKSDIEKNKADLKEEMIKAAGAIRKAKETLTGYHDMLKDMEEDGLIDTKKEYNIDYKNGDLFINNQKQPQKVKDKYSHYFKNGNTGLYVKDGKMTVTN